MQLDLFTAQMLTRQSSPPVASSRLDDLPSATEHTLLGCATMSSEYEIKLKLTQMQ